MIILPKCTPNIGESLSTAHKQNKASARRVFVKILRNVKFLGRQGIAFRGHEDAESNFSGCSSCMSWIVRFCVLG